MQTLFGRMDSSFPVEVFKSLDIFDISALISKAALLVSTSLHCRIIAFSCYTPRVTLSMEFKHEQFFHMWDLGVDASASDINRSVHEALLPSSADIFRANTDRGVAKFMKAFHVWGSKLAEQWGH